MLLGGENEFNEAGLYFTRQTLREQLKAVRSHDLVNPADYVLLNAQHRVAGEPMLDTQTFTSFPQLEMKVAGDVSRVPGAECDNSYLRLRGYLGFARFLGGVRLSMGPED